jgi:hypothetical protein
LSSEVGRPAIVLLAVLAPAAGVAGQSVRDHTRIAPDRSTAVTGAQATELTLTLTEAAVRPIQVWVRTAGRVDAAGRTISAVVPAAQAALVKAGQRVRAFPPESRSRMYQARVAHVVPEGARARVSVRLIGPGLAGSARYILEIVTERGESLSVPNEAVIEADGRRLVYVRQAEGRFAPREIRTGVQGELFTEVVGGLAPGEQVVTIGSFFIDAEHRLKGS